MATAAFERDEASHFWGRLGRITNLAPWHLTEVGRAVSLYSLVMPVERHPPDRSFFAPPAFELKLKWRGRGRLPSTPLFNEPARNMLGAALPLVLLAGAGTMLLWAWYRSFVRLATGDIFHALLIAQAVCGWLFYTWFNPFEPFLWIAEFMHLWIAMIAGHSRDRGFAHWSALALLAVGLGLHNLFAFYLPFR